MASESTLPRSDWITDARGRAGPPAQVANGVLQTIVCGKRNAYAILRPTWEECLKVANHLVLLLAGILVLAITACRGSTYQTYGFERANGTLANVLSFSLVADGRSVPIDSAGRLIDRTANPYWVGLYIYPRPQTNVTLTGVKFTGLTSGRSVSLPMSKLRPLDDSTSTLFSGTREMVLPHEDYAVSVYVNVEERGRTSRDSARAIMKKLYTERYVSFWERFTGF